MLNPQLSFSKAHIPSNALPPLREVKSHSRPQSSQVLSALQTRVLAVFAELVPVYLFSAHLPLKWNVELAFVAQTEGVCVCVFEHGVLINSYCVSSSVKPFSPPTALTCLQMCLLVLTYRPVRTGAALFAQNWPQGRVLDLRTTDLWAGLLCWWEGGRVFGSILASTHWMLVAPPSMHPLL